MPAFERQGKQGYKEGLENTIALDEHFGHPHRRYKTIHIAGTNGKGSTAHAIATALQRQGHRVGLFTSPHITNFAERIVVNGIPINSDYVEAFIEREKPFYEQLHPSFFEVTTALAFCYFADEGVDYAVIEVGLGGRLDCTNIIKPILSVITNISLDHTQLLGDTVEKIAAEKAGIIKSGVPVVIGEATEATRRVFTDKAQQVGAPITFAEEVTIEKESIALITKALGSGCYQQRNARTIAVALSLLQLPCTLLSKPITILGRWQVVNEQPRTIIDVGHNVGAWEQLSKQLSVIQNLHVIVGFVSDKDVEGIVALMPRHATYYLTRPSSERGLSELALLDIATRKGLKAKAYSTVAQAYEAATKAALCQDGTEQTIFVGGSFYLIDDFLKM